MTGKPFQAFKGQDHQAHITSHLNFMSTNIARNNPMILGALEKNIFEHISLMAQEQIEVEFREEIAQTTQMQQMMQQMQAMEAELKKVKGDLQTANREEVHAKKRLEVEKFSSKLDKVSNRADMASSLFQARLGDQQKQLMNSETETEQPESLFEEEES